MIQTYEEEEEPSGSGPWGWIAAILGLLVLIAGGVLLFLLLSGGRGAPNTPPSPSPVMVSVPEFVGQLLPDAERAAEGSGVVLTVRAYQQTTEAPENTVISQEPSSGELVARGTRVQVTVATQRTTVLVPDLRLRTETELVAILLENQLQPGARAEAHDAEVPATLVVRTDPRSGIEVARGTVIDYTVSLGPPPTPTAPPPPTEPPQPTPEGPTEPPQTPIIITPEPQTPIIITPPPPPPPTAEPTPVLVGNYSTCAPLAQARDLILSGGLTVGVIFPFEATDEWEVEQQYPPPGEAVPPGTAVHLLVKDPTSQFPCAP